MSGPIKDRRKTDGPDLGTRLDGWKDIAAYLGKVERTVKRWDADRGLPTHRVPGGGRASVYAYTRELDEWLKSGKALEADIASEPAAILEPTIDEQPEAQPADFSQNFPSSETERPASPRIVAGGELTPPQRSHRSWILAFSGLLLAAIIGAAINSPAVRAASEKIAQLLPGNLTGRPHGAAAAVSPAEKKQAHDLYLKGRFEWSQRTPDGLNRALDYFTQALVHDPGNAEAYAGLADTYDLMREYSTMPDSDAYQRAIAAAKKAVELDDSSAEAHRALAFAEFYGSWDFINGEKEFRRAIELNPNDSLAHKWYANALALQRRYPESLKEINIAQELDPSSLSLVADKGQAMFYAGQREEGIATLKEVERSRPEFASPHYYLMRIAFDSRDYPEFLAEGKTVAESKNDSVLRDIVAAAQTGYTRGGERGLLEALYDKQEKYYADGRVTAEDLAQTCDRLGKKEEALRLIEEACTRHDTEALAVKLPSLKDDPQYKSLMNRVRFSGSAAPSPQGAEVATHSDPMRAVPAPR
jgi:tetratricopeptide (TPR) repeat protein